MRKVELHVEKGQGISQAIQTQIGEEVQHPENWNSVIDIVRKAQQENEARVYDENYNADVELIDDENSNDKNFVIHEGTILFAKAVWNKIYELLTGAKPAEEEETLPTGEIPTKAENPPSSVSLPLDKKPPVKDMAPPHADKKIPTGEEVDLKGNLKTEIHRDIDDSMESYTRIVYGKNNQETLKINYNIDGSVNGYEKLEYDAKGNEVLILSYNPDGSVKNYQRIEYDANGNQSRILDYNPDGSVISAKQFEYNKDNFETKQIQYNSDGSVKYYEEKEYNEEGISRIITRNADGSVLKYSDLEKGSDGETIIERDANGNIIFE